MSELPEIGTLLRDTIDSFLHDGLKRTIAVTDYINATHHFSGVRYAGETLLVCVELTTHTHGKLSLNKRRFCINPKAIGHRYLKVEFDASR